MPFPIKLFNSDLVEVVVSNEDAYKSYVSQGWIDSQYFSAYLFKGEAEQHTATAIEEYKDMLTNGWAKTRAQAIEEKLSETIRKKEKLHSKKEKPEVE